MGYVLDFLWSLLQGVIDGPLADVLAPTLVWLSGGALDAAQARFIASALLSLVFVVTPVWFIVYRIWRAIEAQFVKAARGDRFSIVFADLENDPNGRLTRQFRKTLRQVLAAEANGSNPFEIIEAKQFAAERAGWIAIEGQALLRKLNADLLIFGSYESSKDLNVPSTLNLSLLARDGNVGPIQTYALPVFSERAQGALATIVGDMLAAIVLASIPAEVYSGGKYIENILAPILVRLRTLVAKFPASLSWQVKGEILHAYGSTLLTAANQRGSQVLLEEAIAAFRLALLQRTRERAPLAWSATQLNLGAALAGLALMNGNIDLLEEAIAAFRMALQELTRERMPLEWARAQSNLGAALAELANMRGSEALLEEAIAAYRLALLERTRARVPLNWATTQNNLGIALADLARIRGSESLLEEAIAAFRLALQEFTRDRLPLAWATTQNNLGGALSDLAAMRGSQALLREAIVAFRLALQEFSRERVPLYWATTQSNLGNALSGLARMRGSEALFEEAIAAHRLALQEFTRERVPLACAGTQNNLGVALLELGQMRCDEILLNQAVACFDGAASQFAESGQESDAAMARRNLELARRALAACLTPKVTETASWFRLPWRGRPPKKGWVRGEMIRDRQETADAILPRRFDRV
jgi:tetratricopeptide (TPR) repeat protein